jgi:hypothetical protein
MRSSARISSQHNDTTGSNIESMHGAQNFTVIFDRPRVDKVWEPLAQGRLDTHAAWFFQNHKVRF